MTGAFWTADRGLPPAPREGLPRRTWTQRYLIWEGEVRLRDPPRPASDQIVSPYEDQARYATVASKEDHLGANRDAEWAN